MIEFPLWLETRIDDFCAIYDSEFPLWLETRIDDFCAIYDSEGDELFICLFLVCHRPVGSAPWLLASRQAYLSW